VPGAGVNLEVRPLLQDQELQTSVRYWEGAVDAVGGPGGRGYLELTGYGGK
jgi:predicted secreted hydrolase